MATTRVFVTLSEESSWINSLTDKSIIIDFLIKQEFGANIGKTESEQQKLIGEKLGKAQALAQKIKQAKE